MFLLHRLEIIYYYPEIGVGHAGEMEISSVCKSESDCAVLKACCVTIFSDWRLLMSGCVTMME